MGFERGRFSEVNRKPLPVALLTEQAIQKIAGGGPLFTPGHFQKLNIVLFQDNSNLFSHGVFLSVSPNAYGSESGWALSTRQGASVLALKPHRWTGSGPDWPKAGGFVYQIPSLASGPCLCRMGASSTMSIENKRGFTEKA